MVIFIEVASVWSSLDRPKTMSEVSQVSNSSNSEGLGRVGALNENPSLQITTVKLDGSNYLAWSRSALLSIKSRGMVDYLLGNARSQIFLIPHMQSGTQKIPWSCLGC